MTKTPELSRTEVLVAMGLTAVGLLLVSRLWQFLDPMAQFTLVWRGADVLWGMALGLGITALSQLVYWLWPSYRECTNYYLQLVLTPLVWPDLLWLGLLPGLSEELLFRGVILAALTPPWVGLLVSSAGFGVLHMGSWRQWPYGVWATCIGCMLGLAVLARDNLLVAIVAHGLTNWISAGLWKWHNG
jgi:membrane protease YdiL (CAAX protease family)